MSSPRRGVDDDPAAAWAELAPLLAGQQRVRVWNPVTGDFGLKRRLTARLPEAPAAVRIYDRHRRAATLVLDFDTKAHTADEVDRQVCDVVALVSECGGRVLTDRSRSGGRHVYVPLATPLGVEHFAQVLRLLRDRFPALDITPMSNDRQGHITVPGSACKEGGHRELVDLSVDEALAVFRERSAPGVIARMVATLGGVSDLSAGYRAVVDDVLAADRITGTGVGVRLHEDYTVSSPIPAYVAQWAASDGSLPDDGRWHSTSEARQAVIGHAVLRGASLAEVSRWVDDGTWPAVRASYDRRRDPRASRIRRDFHAALKWAARIAHEFRPPGHKNKHTAPAGGSLLDDPPRQKWLADAAKWVQETFGGQAHRWTVLTVLQGLAYVSGVAGETVNGTPVVAVGGRSLSLAAGLLPETTVWDVLAEIREIPGAPIHRIRVGAGQLADCYTLTQARDEHGRPIVEDAERIDRARVEPVHDAWSVLDRGGGRRVYELIVHTGLTCAADVFAAAHVGKSVGYDILARLAQVGLIERRRGRLAAGAVSLDDLADRHHLDQVRDDRIERHRAERELWRAWLEQRFGPPPPDPGPSDPPGIDDAWSDADTAAYLAAVLAAGPPEQSHSGSREAARTPDADLAAALALLAAELGATLIADRPDG